MLDTGPEGVLAPALGVMEAPVSVSEAQEFRGRACALREEAARATAVDDYAGARATMLHAAAADRLAEFGESAAVRAVDGSQASAEGVPRPCAG